MDLDTIKSFPFKLWAAIKKIWPFLVLQSQEASKNYAAHQQRLAEVEVFKEALLEEVRTYSELKKNLLKRLIEASPEERLRIKEDLHSIEREFRKIKVVVDTAKYLPSTQNGNIANENVDGPSHFWMDKFTELAKNHNEEWRSDLLSRALAQEIMLPGSFGARALWFIGVMDESIFHTFASIIDSAIQSSKSFFIPDDEKYLETLVPHHSSTKMATLGTLLFLLSDVNLICDHLVVNHTFEKNTQETFHYGQEKYLVEFKNNFSIGGIIPTTLGEKIARLYEFKPNETGKKIFSSFIQKLNDDKNSISKCD